MQRVSKILQALERIPGALRNEPEDIGREIGDLPAALTLYDPDTLYEDTLYEETLEPVSGPLGEAYSANSPDPSPVFEIPPEIEEIDAQRILSKDAGERIQQKVLVHGIDALGWYFTFHQRSHQWGIYISISGIAHLAARVFHALDCSNTRKFGLAFQAIHRHELLHFAADYMSAQWELAVGQECFWLSRSLKDPKLGYNLQEEMLANGYMLRGFRWPSDATGRSGAGSQRTGPFTNLRVKPI